MIGRGLLILAPVSATEAVVMIESTAAGKQRRVPYSGMAAVALASPLWMDALEGLCADRNSQRL